MVPIAFIIVSVKEFGARNVFFNLSCSCSQSAATNALNVYFAVMMLPMARSSKGWNRTAWRRYLILFLFEGKLGGPCGLRTLICSTIRVGVAASALISRSIMGFSYVRTLSSEWIASLRASESYSPSMTSTSCLNDISSLQLSMKKLRAATSIMLMKNQFFVVKWALSA